MAAHASTKSGGAPLTSGKLLELIHHVGPLLHQLHALGPVSGARMEDVPMPEDEKEAIRRVD